MSQLRPAPARDRAAGRTLLAVALLLPTAIGVQMLRASWVPARPPDVPMLWVQSPEIARRMALSFADVAADSYWVRAVVHYGSERKTGSGDTGQRYALLYPLLDLTTSLDPHFDVASRLGAIFLSEGYPGGPGRPDLAIALLEKGLAADPARWQYEHDIAFVYYWWLKDYGQAAEHFRRAATMPGAPVWLNAMAGVTLARGGDRAGARRLWAELLADADVDWLRRTAEYRLQQLDAMDGLDQLSNIAAAFRARTGRVPRTWDEVVAAGLLRGLPSDPAGAPIGLDAEGRAVLAPDSPLQPLPTFAEPAHD